MRERREDADRDTLFTRFVRGARHPLRASAMAAAAFCLLSGIALTTGIVAAMLGAVAGVAAGEILGRSRVRLSWGIGGLSLVMWTGLAIGALIVRAEWLVSIMGTGGALGVIGLVTYGSVAFFAASAMRTAAKRSPPWLALELGVVVVAVASALAAHRGGVIARPLWLSDFAWRRGLDPADVLLGIGVFAALVSISLLLFERKGRLSLAALPLLPLVALLAVSCFEVTRAEPDAGEASPDATDEQGEDSHETEIEGEHGQGGGGSDGGTSRDGGTRSRDGGMRDGGGRREGGDAGVVDGGGARDGGSSGGGGGGARDGGGSGGGGDGGGSGGGGGDGGDGGSGGGGPGDGGASDPWEGWDAGISDTELPPPRETGGEAGQSGGPPDTGDMMDRPPPTGEPSAAPVAVVLFEADYSPPSETYYFRQEVWSQFDGPRLVPSALPEADRDLATRFPVGRIQITDPPPTEGRTDVLVTIALLVTHPVPFALESPVWLSEARNPNPSRFRRAYRALSRAQSIGFRDLLGRRAGNPEWTEAQRALYLMPHPDARFTEFAIETVNTMPPERRDDPFARAVAIKLRLDALFTYSTAERHADAEDAAVDFFFGNRIGYCVHFAHTAVYLYRAAGIPARVGIGYMSEEANRRGGSTLVIQAGDAHAWPEIYLEGLGWIVLDIAAARNLDPPRMAQDEELQQLLGEMAREQPPDPEDEIAEEEAPRGPSARVIGRAFGVVFAIALALVLMVLYLIKAWRRLAPAFASPRALPRVGYRAALDRLADLGIAREHGETREQFSKRVAATSPAFEHVTSMLLAARLRAPGPTEGREEHDRARWREATTAMQRELRAAAPLWRRMLGWIHPLTFLDAR